jgi:hypothetical protein
MIAEQTAHELAVLLDHWFAYRRVHDRVPGVVATVTINGERIHDGAYGVADLAEALRATSRGFGPQRTTAPVVSRSATS